MENERTYFLEMPTLIAILARQRRSGIIQADSVHIPGIRGSVFVSLAIVDGAVQSCHIVQKQQKILEGAQAYSALQGIPALEWQWQPLASPPAHSPPQVAPERGSVAASRPATRTAQQTSSAQDSSILQQLSRNHRRVLSLCDGTRSLDKIATMLFISPQNLSVYIRDLEQWGLILFR